MPGLLPAPNLGLERVLEQLFELTKEWPRQGEQVVPLLSVGGPERVSFVELPDAELREPRQLFVLPP